MKDPTKESTGGVTVPSFPHPAECDGDCINRYPAKVVNINNHYEILKLVLSYEEADKITEIFETAGIPLRVEM